MEKKDIRTGDILLVSGEWWLARMIQWVTGSEWSHAGIFVWVEGELFVSEAERRGLQLTLWDGGKYRGGEATDRDYVVMRPMDYILDPKKVAKFIMPHMGARGYDYASLAFHQVIFNVTGKWLGKKEVRAARRFYCSEWVAYVYHHFTGFWPDWWQVSPEKLAVDYEDEFMYIG